MNAYELGHTVGMRKEAGLGSLAVKGGKGLWQALKWLGRGGRRVASVPIGKGSRAAAEVAEAAGKARPLYGKLGKGLGGATVGGAGLQAGMEGYQGLMGTTPAEQAAAAARAEGGEMLRTQGELQRRARAFQGAGKQPGVSDIWSKIQTPVALGQTGLSFNPMYGLLGAGGGLALSQLLGGGDRDEEGRPRRRSMLTNPLVLALLLGAGGGILPGLMGGGAGGASAPEGVAA